MNNLRQLCLTALLIFAIAFSAHAGNIECDGVVNPLPPPPTATGDIECDGLIEIFMSLIQGVLSLS